MQLAFYATWEADGHGSGAPDQRVDYPVSEGACAYSSFDDQEEEGGALVARGSLDGGPTAWLIGSEHTVELTRFVDRRGYIYYDLDSCDESTFPFGDAFDVDLPDAPLDGPLYGFFAREAVAIGPRLDLVDLPSDTTPGEPLSHVQDEPFWVEWDYRGDLAEVREESLIRSEMAMVRNIELGEDWGFEALACRPEE
ncbi:MAG: hypothetical protein QGG40_15990, partial [Myxococcota bacterium]|nr:hypothetical protein [Myxococcota bacterium]